MSYQINGLPRGKDGTEALNKRIPTTGTAINGAKATGTLGMATKPTADDTVTIGDNVYTFVATPAANGDVAIGAAIANSQENLVTAINDGDTFNNPHPDVVAADFADDEMIITAKNHGTDANDIDTTETFADETDAWGAAKMSGGVAGVAGEPGEMLINDTTLFICMSADTGPSPSVWKKITLATL